MGKQLLKKISLPVFLLAAAYFINTHVARLAIVSGESMYPTFLDGDILLVNEMNYIPSRGDVVLIDISERPVLGKYIVKRVIAVEGDTVELDYESNSVLVNGVQVTEPYLNFDQDDPMKTLDSIDDITYQVPPGTIFVMGDNRNNSLDSRSNILGMINSTDVVWKVCKHFSFLQYFN